MKILALERERVRLDAATAPALLREEARVLWDLVQEGRVRECHFRADRHEAVLTLEAPDLEAARADLARLPLVRGGHIDFDLVPLAPYDGFARLFGEVRP